MSKNLKIKIGVEIDSTKTKMELEKTLQSLQKNKVKIGFDVDTKSLNALKQTLDSFKNMKINIGVNGSSDSIKGVSNSVKATNTALNEQKQLYSQLKQLQNEEYAIKKKLVTADGESKKVLTENLAIVKQQQSAIQNKISASSKGLSNDQKELQLQEQKLRKERELAQAKAKTNTEMQKAISNAQSNMNTKGFNTKQIEDYRQQLEAIDRTNMSNVRREIESIGRAMDDQRNGMKNFGEEMINIGSAMQGAGTAILEVFALPMAGIAYATETMMNYTYEMSNVQAVSQATAEEMVKLDDMTKELGRTTVWSK